MALIESPLFLAAVAAIEKKIGEADRIARAHEVSLTDAQIISVLRRVANSARGKERMNRPARLPRDQILSGLTEQLILLRDCIFETKIEPNGKDTETPFSTEHWVAALKVVQKSIRQGTGTLVGSRGFLDSLGIFLSGRR